jgi:hypothetical protein
MWLFDQCEYDACLLLPHHNLITAAPGAQQCSDTPRRCCPSAGPAPGSARPSQAGSPYGSDISFGLPTGGGATQAGDSQLAAGTAPACSPFAGFPTTGEGPRDPVPAA